MIFRNITQHLGRAAQNYFCAGDIAGHHCASSYGAITLYHFSRQDGGIYSDAAAAFHGNAFEMFEPFQIPRHIVIVAGGHARRYETIVFHRRIGGDIDIGFEFVAIADLNIVFDCYVAADDIEVADFDIFADGGQICNEIALTDLALSVDYHVCPDLAIAAYLGGSKIICHLKNTTGGGQRPFADDYIIIDPHPVSDDAAAVDHHIVADQTVVTDNYIVQNHGIVPDLNLFSYSDAAIYMLIHCTSSSLCQVFSRQGIRQAKNDFRLRKRSKPMHKWIQKHLDQLSVEGKSPHTISAYRIDLQQFESFLESEFGTVSIPEIAAIHIRGFLRWLSEKQDGNRTLSRKLSALSSWFKFLKIQGIIKDDPMRKIRRPKYEKKLPKFFSEEEMQVLLRIPDTSSKFGLRNRAILELLYSCGLRLTELAGLRLRDVDQHKKLIRVVGKGNKQRLIPVGSFALQSLNEYLALRPSFLTEDSSNKVFLTRSGKDFNTAQLNIILMRYIALIAREKGYSPHAIRHSFATHLLSNGAEIEAIQEMLGHANLSTTETYTYLSLEDIKKAYEKGHPRSGE